MTTWWQLASLLLGPDRTHADRTYALLGDRVLGETTMYNNLGYWDGATTFDDACQAMAHQLAIAVGMRGGDRVLDCGFGFADQDLYWATAFEPAQIIGLNITALQVERARTRVAERGLADRIDLRLGSATAMPVPAGTIDRVTALESAFHFASREEFFAEAFRVLRPGGTFGAADMIARDGRRRSVRDRIELGVLCAFWQAPRANFCSAAAYRTQLEAAGFRNVQVRSIREYVYTPFARYLAAHRLPEARGVDRVIAAIVQGGADERVWEQYDYVLATGEKPSSTGPATTPSVSKT